MPLTLGLSILVAYMQLKWLRTGEEVYRNMAKFWGKLFLINFALGVVTGIALEFQFGTNWSRYSAFVGDIFGSLLAIEALVAFFLESTLSWPSGFLAGTVFLLKFTPPVFGWWPWPLTFRPFGFWRPIAGCRIRSAIS